MITKLLVSLGILLCLAACGSSSAPVAPTDTLAPTAIPSPTPNFEATVAAAIQATVEAAPTGTAPPLPTPTKTIEPQPTHTIVPTETNQPTPSATKTPEPTPTNTVTPIPPTPISKWDYFEDRDVISDILTQMIAIDADSGTSRFGEVFTLSIGCIQDEFFQISVNWKSFIDLDSTEITYRIDSQTAQTAKWSIGSGGDDTYLFDAKAKQFVNSLLDGGQLVLRVTPFRETSLTATFDITGIEEAVEPIFAGCLSVTG